MTDQCAHPDCDKTLRDNNVTNVCRNHIHSKFCKCLSCLGHPKAKTRVRTRAELVALGLLPEERIFT